MRQCPSNSYLPLRRRNQRGLTLVELIVAFTIMLILTTMAVPMARSRVRRERERELRYALREITAKMHPRLSVMAETINGIAAACED